MAFLIIIFCVLVSAVVYAYDRNIYNPITVFFLFWAVITFFASLCLFGLYKTSDRAYTIIFIGLFSYFVGCAVVYYVKGNNGEKHSGNKGINTYEIRYKLLYILYAITIIFLLYNFVNVLELLKSGYTMTKIRSLYSNQFSSEGYNEVTLSPINVVIKQFISTPVVYASLPIVIVDMIAGEKNKKLLVMTVSMMALWMLSSGGRSIIVWFIIYVVCTMVIYRKKIKIPKYIKRIIKIIVLVLGVICAYVTIARKGEELDILKELYIYFPVAIKNFDYHINQFDMYYRGNNLYGLASFYGFLYPIVFVFKQFGIMDYPAAIIQAKYLSFSILEPNVYIGLYMNAYATMFYQPYVDGGILGVVIILFGFGLLCGGIYHQVKYKKTMRDVAIYLLLIQKLLFSHVRFYFAQTPQAIAFIIVVLAFGKTKGKRRLSDD